MVSAILFAFYFLILLFFFGRLLSKMKLTISPSQTILIFSFRVALGCLYGYIFLHFYGGDDTWMFFQDSLFEKSKLFHHPLTFFTDFLPNAAFQEGHNFLEGLSYYRRNLEYYSMVKMLAIFDLISGDNYYVDLLLFEFLIIWGPVLLFRLLIANFPFRRTPLMAIIFFVPPIHFWLCGIRAEGLLLLFMALILYHTNRWFERKRVRDLIILFTAAFGFLIYRGQYLAIFLPAFFGWTLTRKKDRFVVRSFAVVYLLCLIAFVASLWASPKLNLATPIVHTQQRFLELRAKTRLPLGSLEPTVTSFIKVLPRAFVNTFVQPTLISAKGLLQISAALEIMAFWLLCVLFLIFRRTDWKEIIVHPLSLLFLFYGFTQVIMIGFTVPFPGAIIRYKAIPNLLIVIIIGLSIDWLRIYKLIK